MICIGDSVISLLNQAEKDVLIVAPFIRSNVLSRILECIHSDVKIRIVTRWRPADIVAGASDLGVFDVTKNKNIPLYLRHDLHAKLFAADELCLVGSANVTGVALGWKVPTNLELLVPIARSSDCISSFEKNLFVGAVRATLEIKSELDELIMKFNNEKGSEYRIHSEDSVGLLPLDWIPQNGTPEDMYRVYKQHVDVHHTLRKVIQNELVGFGIVSGVSEEKFNTSIPSAICQTPLVTRVVEHIERYSKLSESQFNDILNSIGIEVSETEAQKILNILVRWLNHFLPTSFKLTQQNVVLIKARDM